MRRPLPSTDVLPLLAEATGLTSAEVEQRRLSFGPNDIVESAPSGWRQIGRDTAKDPMIWFLVATSGLFAVVGDSVEALVMLGALAPIIGMDAFLHRRTLTSTAALATRLAERATVRRNGTSLVIPSAEVVPGDLALIAAGESFPADGIIVAGERLQADESSLTGEAFPVGKLPLRGIPAAGEAIDSDQWGFAGTRLLVGEAQLRVVATGRHTLYGEIVRSASGGGPARTPLQQAIARLVAILLAAAAVLCVALAWVRWHQGRGLVDALVSAVTLAVAAIPEEFPIVFTFFLGTGVFRLARRRALVRRAVVVENIGRVSCICTDKTGTLTEGRVRVAHRFPADGVPAAQLDAVAALASRRDSGDPLDAAVVAAGMQAPPDVTRLATYPFTEDRRRETGVFRTATGGTLVASKGAPETILPLCDLNDAERQAWTTRVNELAASAHKVLACAWQDASANVTSEPVGGYRFAGLFACEDPLREGVADAVREAENAGIKVLMVTGDHPATAAAVAREAGIGSGAARLVEAEDLAAALSNQPDMLERIDVVARAMPAQKLSLVRALQAQGAVVAVTGDGVNDVPALQAADVGIAMGERGTRSAREVSAIVLLDDNFRTIVNAIAEGRQLFRNLRLSFAYLLMLHIPLVLTALVVPLVGYPLLYLPVHVVWLELIIHPTALLVFQQQASAGPLIPRSARRLEARFFGAWEWLVVATVGAAITAAVMLGYERSLGADVRVEHARAMAMVSLVIASAMVTTGLSALRTWAARIVVTASVASAIVLVQAPNIAALLHLEPLHADDWALAAAGGSLAGVSSALFRWHQSRGRSAGS